MNTDNPESRMTIRVTPNAPRNEITGYREGVLSVKIAAPPVRGKANRELITFLSKTLGVSKSTISVLKGETGRHKVVAVSGLTPEEILQRLSM
ncbi:MAG: YggU family protein [Chloroflexi bacterium RBG_16_56_11]|nr:MAG: YggU family protein [Chloroflexi bacterium RBG_16_56_11]